MSHKPKGGGKTRTKKSKKNQVVDVLKPQPVEKGLDMFTSYTLNDVSILLLFILEFSFYFWV